MAEAASLAPGRALDTGCGHGADTLWLASRGWSVTAVAFSPAALAWGQAMAERVGADVAARIGAATAAADQVQVSVDAAAAALDADVWDLLVAEERVRPAAGTGVDAVIHARRRA